MYPYQPTPMGNRYISPKKWVFMCYNPQESLQKHQLNTMGTLGPGYTRPCPLKNATFEAD